MGYRGNYTGYGVSGLDVFLWILLTAGTLGFSVIVITICFIKKHFHDQKRLPTEEDFSESKLKKIGIMGPYFNSETQLNKPTIVNETDTDKYGRVRFKDEMPSINLNISNPKPIIKNPTISYPNAYTNAESVNNFAPKLPTFSNPPSFLRNNNIQQEQTYSVANSISDSNNLQLSHKDLSSLDLMNQSGKARESFENLYTQVQPQASRQNMSRMSNDTFHNLNNQDFNDDFQQVVYMNTNQQ